MLYYTNLTFLLVYACYFVNSYETNTLEVVHIIFRHGEKNPDIQYTYPKDPHINQTFEPYPQGQLKKIGRKTMYNLGITLRQRYVKFLGKIYSQNTIEAWSSPFIRSIFSLQVVLASLFSPSKSEMWHNNLNWQPIFYNYMPANQDKLFLNFFSREYEYEYSKVCKSEEVQTILKEYKSLLKYIEHYSGLTGTCPKNAYQLYMLLDSEKESNLTLPEWTKTIYPQKLKELTNLEYRLETSTPKLKSILIGNLLMKIYNDTINRTNGKSEKKFFIYSGHDLTIAHTLAALGFMYPHIPNYGACIAIEVHKIENKYFLKIFYRDSKYTELKLEKNDKSEEMISLEDFEKVIINLRANDSDNDPDSSASFVTLNVYIVYLSLHALYFL